MSRLTVFGEKVIPRVVNIMNIVHCNNRNKAVKKKPIPAPNSSRLQLLSPDVYKRQAVCIALRFFETYGKAVSPANGVICPLKLPKQRWLK